MYMNDGNKTKINLRNKSVFITGVAGFIGSNLAKRLLSTVEDVKVVGLDNMNHYYDVRLKEARLNELEQFENFSFVKGKQKTRPYEITVIDDGTSTDETRLGAVKDIQLAVEKLNLADDLLVMAGDNVLDFSLSKFVEFAKEKDTSCVMCHVENELKKQQKTAIITLDGNDLITSYEEKPKEPKGNLAVPPFYCYRACDVKRIQEALDNGCGYDAPGSFAAWLSKQTPMHAYVMWIC